MRFTLYIPIEPVCQSYSRRMDLHHFNKFSYIKRGIKAIFFIILIYVGGYTPTWMKQIALDIEVANAAVHKDWKAALPCYPRRSFYLLSTDPSTWCPWITISDLRLSSSHRTYCQANLYSCALQDISDVLELTIEFFCYFLKRSRPKKTGTHTLVPTVSYATTREWYFIFYLLFTQE